MALVPVWQVVQEEPIALAGVIFRGLGAETEALSEAVPEDSMDRTRGATALVAPPAWDLVAEASIAVEEVSAAVAEASVVVAADSVVVAVDSVVVEAAAGAVVVGAGNEPHCRNTNSRSTDMKSIFANTNYWRRISVLRAITCVCVPCSVPFAAQLFATSVVQPTTVRPATDAKAFDTPQKAADALVDAAEKFDVTALTEIFGPKGDEVVFSGEFGQDRQRAADFAAAARERKHVSVDPKSGNRAFLLVGNEDWPFPVPLVKRGQKWFFDSKAGRQELLYRRIGANELDAIKICRGYVDAQREYAFQQRAGYDVHQYAQRIVSTPGKQDGLAWQNSEGEWDGPIGENIARAIEQGYTKSAEPYHGYFFKILKGQGPAATPGEMDFVVNGIMIGGFALIAAPAEYNVTGVRTFIVSHGGVVYEKDLGPKTVDEFKTMERFNPDRTWTVVTEKEE